MTEETEIYFNMEELELVVTALTALEATVDDAAGIPSPEQRFAAIQGTGGDFYLASEALERAMEIEAAAGRMMKREITFLKAKMYRMIMRLEEAQASLDASLYLGVSGSADGSNNNPQ